MEVQPEVCEEKLPSIMVTRVLGELEPQEEVVESESSDEGELIEVSTFAFEGNKEGKLLIDLSVEQPLPK